MTEYCKVDVRGEGAWGSLHRHRCANKAKRDGYCGIHHPDAVKRRREKSAARFKKDAAEMDAQYMRESFNLRAGARCRELGIQPEEIKA